MALVVSTKQPFLVVHFRPWCGRLARTGETVYLSVPVIPADRNQPLPRPWCGLSARAVARGLQASTRAPGIPGLARGADTKDRKKA